MMYSENEIEVEVPLSTIRDKSQLCAGADALAHQFLRTAVESDSPTTVLSLTFAAEDLLELGCMLKQLTMLVRQQKGS